MPKRNLSLTFPLFLLLLFCSQFSDPANAQSGRQVPNSESITENSPNEQTNCEPDLPEHIYISPRKMKAFTEELNRFGKCGYRLEKANKIPLMRVERDVMDIDFFGVMKLDLPHRYEYQWFEAFSPGEAQTRMNYRAEQGFYFKASFPFQIIAENRDGDWVDPITNKFRSNYGSFLIFEKRDDEIRKREYRILDSDGIGKEVRERNQNRLDDFVKKGFVPVGLVKQRELFGIIVEKTDDESIDAEYKILNFNFNLTNKLTELSKTGFAPDILIPYAAVLKKESNFSTQTKSFKVFENVDNLYKKPSLLNGYYYLKSGLFYYDDRDLQSNLLFVNTADPATKFNYKFHKMSDVSNRSKGEDKYDSFRKKPTAEMSAEFQNLLKQGFKIREVLATDEIYILFERPEKPLVF